MNALVHTLANTLTSVRQNLGSNLLFNGICFQGLWVVAVVLQQPVVMSLLLLLWLGVSPLPAQQIRVMLLLAAAGIVVDQGLLAVGFYYFGGQQSLLPAWLILLWLAFARFMLLFQSGFAVSTQWLALLCLVGGVSSYFGAEQLGAVLINWDMTVPLSLFLLWWGLLPYFSRWLDHRYG